VGRRDRRVGRRSARREYAITLPWALGDYDDGRSHGVLHVATAVGLPLSAYIVAASVYFATTIPYSSDFFCDG